MTLMKSMENTLRERIAIVSSLWAGEHRATTFKFQIGRIPERILTSLWRGSHETFSSLYIRNYRLYYVGQIISTSGTFMQSVAQAWLVLQLTHSGLDLGITSTLQYLPFLILGPYGGVVADRFSKRKILYVTQSLA